jgi:hypothetical protein
MCDTENKRHLEIGNHDITGKRKKLRECTANVKKSLFVFLTFALDINSYSTVREKRIHSINWLRSYHKLLFFRIVFIRTNISECRLFISFIILGIKIQTSVFYRSQICNADFFSVKTQQKRLIYSTSKNFEFSVILWCLLNTSTENFQS